MNLGFPVNRRVKRALDYHAAKLKDKGEWEVLVTKYRPESVCGDEENEGPEKLDVESMAGAFWVFFGFVGVGSILKLLACCCGDSTDRGALTVLFGCLGYGFPVRDTTVKNPDSDDEDDQHEMVGRHLQHNMLEDEEDDVELKPGAAVEYYSETRREWFPATILSVDAEREAAICSGKPQDLMPFHFFRQPKKQQRSQEQRMRRFGGRML
jgi:hypothetical protein